MNTTEKGKLEEYKEKIENMPREQLNALALNLLILISPLLRLSEIAEVIVVKASETSEQNDSKNESDGV